MLDRNRERRIGSAHPKEKPGTFSLEEAIRGLPPAPVVLAERPRREAEAAGLTEKPDLPPEHVQATAAPIDAALFDAQPSTADANDGSRVVGGDMPTAASRRSSFPYWR
jgi:hypothetical protein